MGTLAITIFPGEGPSALYRHAELHQFTRCIQALSQWHRILPVPSPQDLAEPFRWAYYPWRRTLVSVLGPKAFRRLRLDRNRNKITAAEQQETCLLYTSPSPRDGLL